MKYAKADSGSDRSSINLIEKCDYGAKVNLIRFCVKLVFSPNFLTSSFFC